MLKIQFKDRPAGRRFWKVSKKHVLFKMYLEGWIEGKLCFKFENEEQSEVISDIILSVLNEMGLEYTIVE